jgi:predicted hotdog family 3-hydroxylacyl-ACP dehydratase
MGKSMVDELQPMNVFNSAINVATLDAGIKIAATVDPGAWFLNPQSGIVNLSNIEMATTAIGAMNSSITRLGKNLATVTTVTP